MAGIESGSQAGGDHTDKVSQVSVMGSKEALIIDACEKRDADKLRALAITTGGFLSDRLRSLAWPILLGSNAGTTPDNSKEIPDSWRNLPRHRDEDQVRLDVDRSFVYYPNDNTQSQLEEKKSQLSDLITQVLREQPYLCYFQGYHDICQVLLLALPADLRAVSLARLSVLRIRDFMLPTLAPAVAQLRLIPDLLLAVDPALYHQLSRNEPFFALADTLTMFAHNVQRYSDIARLFDALIAREQVFCLYIFTQIVLRRRDELLAHEEPDMLHFALSKLPQDIDLDAVIAEAVDLFDRHPPESLPAWRRISAASVLKTTRDVNALTHQTLQDGQAFFQKLERELRWDERRQKVVKTAWANRTLLFTILVAATAIYLRKTPVWASLVGMMRLHG